MMVTFVRGHFKGVHGKLEFDGEQPDGGSVEVTLDARALNTGEPARDAHLKSADFLDVEHHPEIHYRGRTARRTGATDWTVAGELTLRGVTRPVELEVHYLGSWLTPWWRATSTKVRRSAPAYRAGDHRPAAVRCQLEQHARQRRRGGGRSDRDHPRRSSRGEHRRNDRDLGLVTKVVASPLPPCSLLEKGLAFCERARPSALHLLGLSLVGPCEVVTWLDRPPA